MFFGRVSGSVDSVNGWVVCVMLVKICVSLLFLFGIRVKVFGVVEKFSVVSYCCVCLGSWVVRVWYEVWFSVRMGVVWVIEFLNWMFIG